MLIQNRKPIVEKDLVLIYIQDQPTFFARVENIVADIKPKWWRVTFLFLKLPLETFTWILDDHQIRGADFTMGGTPIRLELVISPIEKEDDQPPQEDSDEPPKEARILSLNPKKPA
jgi:hypothetical protein